MDIKEVLRRLNSDDYTDEDERAIKEWFASLSDDEKTAARHAIQEGLDISVRDFNGLGAGELFGRIDDGKWAYYNRFHDSLENAKGNDPIRIIEDAVNAMGKPGKDYPYGFINNPRELSFANLADSDRERAINYLSGKKLLDAGYEKQLRDKYGIEPETAFNKGLKKGFGGR